MTLQELQNFTQGLRALVKSCEDAEAAMVEAGLSEIASSNLKTARKGLRFILRFVAGLLSAVATSHASSLIDSHVHKGLGGGP